MYLVRILGLALSHSRLAPQFATQFAPQFGPRFDGKILLGKKNWKKI
jgi:hypothetical protein